MGEKEIALALLSVPGQSARGEFVLAVKALVVYVFGSKIADPRSLRNRIGPTIHLTRPRSRDWCSGACFEGLWDLPRIALQFYSKGAASTIWNDD
jgi:hypothetical protein